jgi:nucleotide-binding universal stress UspA family protein
VTIVEGRAGGPMYGRILVAIDESQSKERVLAAAKELATLSSGEVFLLHVWEAEPSRERSLSATSWQDANAMVSRAAEQLAGAGIKAHGEIASNLCSRAGLEITGYAKKERVDVIVMGSRGMRDLAGLITGSTVRKVLQKADCQVVLVP